MGLRFFFRGLGFKRFMGSGFWGVGVQGLGSGRRLGFEFRKVFWKRGVQDTAGACGNLELNRLRTCLAF